MPWDNKHNSYFIFLGENFLKSLMTLENGGKQETLEVTSDMFHIPLCPYTKETKELFPDHLLVLHGKASRLRYHRPLNGCRKRSEGVEEENIGIFEEIMFIFRLLLYPLTNFELQMFIPTICMLKI